MATKRAKKATDLEAANNTFEHLAREWYAVKCKTWTEGTAVRTIGALEKHVFPVFGKRPYTGIMPMEWMEFLRCWRRPKTDPPCRLKIDPGKIADFSLSNCG
jgi:hypothetical protein